MKRPAFALEIRTGKPGEKPGSARDEDDESDDDEYEDMFGGGDSAPQPAHGGDEDGDGGDESDHDDEDGDDAGDGLDDLHGDDGDHPELSPHELAHTSLADATYEQLCAAMEMKRPKGESDDSGDDVPNSDPSDIT